MSLFKRDPVRDLWRAYIGNTKNLDSYRRLREHWIFSPEGPDTLKAKIAELGSPNPLMSALYLLAKRGEVPGVGVRAEIHGTEIQVWFQDRDISVTVPILDDPVDTALVAFYKYADTHPSLNRNAGYRTWQRQDDEPTTWVGMTQYFTKDRWDGRNEFKRRRSELWDHYPDGALFSVGYYHVFGVP